MVEAPVGRIADAARRALGQATPAPGFPMCEYLVQRWLAAIAASAKRGKHQATASRPLVELRLDERLLAASDAEGWDTLRRITARGEFETATVTSEHAAWMDAGMFARTVSAELPPVDALAKQARRRVDAAGRKQIDDCVARLRRDRAA